MKFLDIQVLRAVAILSIVFGHSLAIHTSAWSFIYKIEPFMPFKIIGFLFSSYFLWLFVIISGFLFAHQVEKKDLSFKYFVKSKFNRLLIPYFIWGILYYLIFNNVSDYSIIGLLSQLGNGIGHLWFLLMLFWVFILSFWLVKFKLSQSSNILIISLFFIIGIILLSCNWNILQLSSSFKYLFGFYCGWILYNNQFKLELITSKKRNKLILLFFFMFLMKYGGEYILRSVIKTNDTFIIEIYKEIVGLPLGLLASIIIYIIVKQYVAKKNKSIKYLEIIEKESFGIYILHQFIMLLFLTHLCVHISPIVLPFILAGIGLGGSLLGLFLIKKIKIFDKII